MHRGNHGGQYIQSFLGFPSGRLGSRAMGDSCISFHIPMFTRMAFAFLMCFLIRSSQRGQNGMSPQSLKYRVSPLFTSAPQSWQTLLFINGSPPAWYFHRRPIWEVLTPIEYHISPGPENILLPRVDIALLVAFLESVPAVICQDHIPWIGRALRPSLAEYFTGIEEDSSPSPIWSCMLDFV